MINYKDALARIIESAGSNILGSEKVLLGNAIGRILVEDVVSAEEVPSFDNSAMDGFSVLASDTSMASSGQPCKLEVLGLIAAGDPVANIEYSQGIAPNCLEIMTGAPLPKLGYDAVIRIEDVLVERNSEGIAKSIKISRTVAQGENIRPRGTDFKIGQKVLPRGTRIGPHHILSCAALGITELTVRKRPRFAVVSTGSELVSSETKTLGYGLIRNSTGPYLIAALQEMGVEVCSFGIIHDSPEQYRDLLRRLCDESYDGVVSTGAVSMGKFDFVNDTLRDFGADILFHKVAIRPGKPILFAELKAGSKTIPFFGMPGNPVSTAVGCRFFLAPYLRVVSGLGEEKPITARLSLEAKKPAGLRCFYKAQACFGADGIQVAILKSQASYVVSTLTESNCWAIFSEDSVQMDENAMIEIYPLNGALSEGFL